MATLTKAIPIKEYKTRLVGKDIHYFAIDDKGKEYEMPPQFAEMYTEDYLAIRKKIFVRPDVFGLQEAEQWIPLRTNMKTKA